MPWLQLSIRKTVVATFTNKYSFDRFEVKNKIKLNKITNNNNNNNNNKIPRVAAKEYKGLVTEYSYNGFIWE